MNADAPQYDVRSLPEPAQLLLAAEEGRHRSVGQGNGLWSGRTLGAAAPDHVGVDVLTLTWGRPLLRASLMQTQIGRASCREKVVQYVSVWGGAVALKKKK